MPHDKDLKIIGLEELRSHNNMEDGLWVSYHGHVNSAWIQEHVDAAIMPSLGRVP